METFQSKPYWIQRWISLMMVLLGFALLLFMIIVEDEPGAVPLGMMAAGTLWYFLIRKH